jgi:dTDP-4-dehydrorhamnose reductase
LTGSRDCEAGGAIRSKVDSALPDGRGSEVGVARSGAPYNPVAMRALITGMNGTVGSALAAALRLRGDAPIPYARGRAEFLELSFIARCLSDARPDVVFHLAIASKPAGLENEQWRVNVEWPARLAAICAAAGIRFVFTSTAMVFSDRATGPFTVDREPDAADGYGLQKRTAERLVRQAYPDAVVVRLGWQIGEAPGGNQMLSYFEQHMREHGVVRASRRWLPACSFLEDTAAGLIALEAMPGGLYQLDSNTRWSFYEIAAALNERAGPPWRIEPTDDFVFDQRLLDARLKTPPLSARLPRLAGTV